MSINIWELSLLVMVNLKYAAEQLADHARKAFYATKHYLPFYDKLSVKPLLKLYSALIELVLKYGLQTSMLTLTIETNYQLTQYLKIFWVFRRKPQI
jgi:hypothetical protein